MPKSSPPRALHDPVLCLAPGLFLSLIRGERDRPLEIAYAFGPDDRYLFNAPSRLGCDDLRVLQGIVALANRAPRCISPDSTPSGLMLYRELLLSGTVEGAESLLVETSLASIASSAGYGAGRGGAMGVQLRASLTRLASVAVRAETVDDCAGWQLIAWDENGTGRNRVRIALNPRLGLCAKALEYRFVQIEMAEARSIKGDLARLLHQRLSGWIDAPGSRDKPGERKVTVKTLMEYAWGNLANKAAKRQRLGSLKSALGELEELGWKIRRLDTDGLLEITRPPSAKHRAATADSNLALQQSVRE